MKYAPPRIATYSHALRAMNSSVPLSPPLMRAALTRMLTTRTIIAQNSVVLNDALVSWFRSATAPRIPVVRGVSTRRLSVAPVVAMGDSFVGSDACRSSAGRRLRIAEALLLSSPRQVVAALRVRPRDPSARAPRRQTLGSIAREPRTRHR